MAILAIDFDGTCVEHDFPRVGADIGAVPVLKELVDRGHQLILWTVRANVTDPFSDSVDPTIVLEAGQYLDDAVAWFKENDIRLYGINENASQRSWSLSPKVFVHLYIDDRALGTPLTESGSVDWSKIRILLKNRGYL